MAEQQATRDSDHGRPYSEARRSMLSAHHRQTLWIPWTLILLGVWVAIAPFNFGYLNEATWVDPSGGRGAWFSSDTHTAMRAALMTWSDVASGAALVALGLRALTPGRPISWWLACAVGAWLSAAPVMLWSPVAAGYLNDTFVGMLVIALTILVPGMPNMTLYMRMGEPTPPGWTYNPSSWAQRWVMIVTGFLGFLVSRQLAMYQLGYVDRVWEPFFGDGAVQVLNSEISHSIPVSDAALGSLAYTFEFLMGYMGGASRWRTMPWMVTLFGILVIPLGLVHIVLVISQPLVVGSWCTLCLAAAAIMLLMIPLEADEVVAMGQHLKQARKRRESMWSVFWKGGAPEGCGPDERTPELQDMPRRPGQVIAASFWGMRATWRLTTVTALGIVTILLPAVVGIDRPAASALHLAGALTVVVGVVSMGEVLRIGRLLALLLGLTIAIAPQALDGAAQTGRIGAVLLGLAIGALGLPRGAVREHYGGWDRLIR